jgi:hypothetical protein
MIGTANTITARAYVVHSEEAPTFWQLSNLWRVFTTGVQTGNSCCLLDQLVMPKGGGPCTHAHTVVVGGIIAIATTARRALSWPLSRLQSQVRCHLDGTRRHGSYLLGIHRPRSERRCRGSLRRHGELHAFLTILIAFGRFVRCLDDATKSQFGSQTSLSRPSEKAVRYMTIELSP